VPVCRLCPRYDRVLAAYYAAFGAGRPLEFVIRAPGRVNLIGEHIDYCGGSVLPMCIENDVLVAGARNSSAIVYMCNTNSKYPHKIVTLKKGEEVVIDKYVVVGWLLCVVFFCSWRALTNACHGFILLH
jgi:galactokinase